MAVESLSCGSHVSVACSRLELCRKLDSERVVDTFVHDIPSNRHRR